METTARNIHEYYEACEVDLLNLTHDRPWIKDADRVLDEYFLAGYTAYEIASDLNRTVPDIVSRIMKHCMEGTLSMQDFAKTAQYDKPTHFMEKNFRRSAKTAICSGKKKSKRKFFHESEIQEMREMRQEGKTYDIIGKSFGVSRQVVIKLIPDTTKKGVIEVCQNMIN